MFGAGWTEMLIIGVVALVVIGPKDLPIVMRKFGRMVGTVRRMGDEFQRELNKTTGLDQITDLKRSITEPLRQTSQEIVAEFNKVTATGVEPSGIIKPTDPAVESVYDQIAATSGLAQSTPPAVDSSSAVAPPPVMKPLAAAEAPAPTPAEALPPAATRARPKRSSKPRAESAAEQPAKRSRKAVAAKPVAAKAATTTRKAAKETVVGETAAVSEAETVPMPQATPSKPKRTRTAKPAAQAAPAVPADVMGNDAADANAEKA